MKFIDMHNENPMPGEILVYEKGNEHTYNSNYFMHNKLMTVLLVLSYPVGAAIGIAIAVIIG